MQDLYNRVRPRKFSDMLSTSTFLKGIDDIVADTLEGKPGLHHVMIFYSHDIPGIGKTTCARILCSVLNPNISGEMTEMIFTGQPCPVCIENNATDLKKDDVASLIGRMMACRDDLYDYRYVFIINQAEKLTDDSVTLLLSVENLPDNVYVIMTTTDTSRVRPDLLSRTRTYTFRQAPDASVIKLLKEIVISHKDEYPFSARYDITKDDDMFLRIATMSMGSIRDAVKLLEQYMSHGEIDRPNDVSTDDQDKYRIYFGKFLDLWVGIMEGGTSWSDIASQVRSMTVPRGNRPGMPAEEFRKHFMFRIYGVIISDRAIEEGLTYNESLVYSIVEKHISEPISYPPLTQLVLRLHMAFMEIKEVQVRSKPAE